MNNLKGFTLMELLVVMGIMAILLAIIQPTITTSAGKSREYECDTHMKQIGMAMQAYLQDYGAFPVGLSRLNHTLQDRHILQCTGTGSDYWYANPGQDAKGDTVVAACVKPGTPRSQWPHRVKSSYLALTANGGVRRVTR